jgi:LuxR family maltose regulon positive regulatory protein
LAAAQKSLTKIPPEWWMLRAHAWMWVSVASLATGDLRQAYDAVYDSGEANHGGAFQMRLYASACFIHWMDADLFGLRQVTTLILKKSGLVASRVETTTWARYHLGIVHYQHNNLADAEQELAPLIRQRYRTHAHCFLNGAAALALVYQAQGRPEKAREIAELMGAFALENHSNIVHFTAKAFQAELALRQGRLAEARFWADHTDVSLTLPMPFFYNPSLTYVRIRLAESTGHSRQQARQMLRELYLHNTATHNTVMVIQILALQVLLDQAEGNASAARHALQQAIGLAEPGGFIRAFVDLGQPLQQVLAAWMREREASPYEARILAAFPQRSSPAVVRYEANAALLSPLSPRELEVLALLEKRYTDMEIAETLTISQNTVRSHIRHIGEKLGANGRRAIVDAAGEEDLL